MTDRPILFSGPMVLALLAGRKTQTRRVIKPQPPEVFDFLGIYAPHLTAVFSNGNPDHDITRRLYSRGDLLWVRETHMVVGTVDPGWVIYRANGYEAECRRHGFDNPPDESTLKWKPSIYMPRWASRLTLDVTDVRVERVQDISEADARAEGVLWVPGHGEITSADLMADPGYSNFLNCREGYQYLWNSLNAKRGFGWDENPWVSVTTFNVHSGNIDAVKERL